MLSGLPASGKSTKAEELVKSMGNAVRVNKDLIRTMLHFDKWSGRNEGITKDIERQVAIQAITRHGMNVIVDDTNLGTNICFIDGDKLDELLKGSNNNTKE